jgi:hypothetical protein
MAAGLRKSFRKFFESVHAGILSGNKTVHLVFGASCASGGLIRVRLKNTFNVSELDLEDFRIQGGDFCGRAQCHFLCFAFIGIFDS